MLLTIPLVLLFGAATYMCYRLSDARVLHLVCALIFGFCLAAGPLATPINAALTAGENALHTMTAHTTAASK